MDRIEVGNKIRKLRIEKGLSQCRLAALSGISTSYLPEIERGEKCPSVEALDNICFGLGITLQQFFAEDEKQNVVEELTPQQKQLLNDFLKSL